MTAAEQAAGVVLALAPAAAAQLDYLAVHARHARQVGRGGRPNKLRQRAPHRVARSLCLVSKRSLGKLPTKKSHLLASSFASIPCQKHQPARSFPTPTPRRCAPPAACGTGVHRKAELGASARRRRRPRSLRSTADRRRERRRERFRHPRQRGVFLSSSSAASFCFQPLGLSRRACVRLLSQRRHWLARRVGSGPGSNGLPGTRDALPAQKRACPTSSAKTRAKTRKLARACFHAKLSATRSNNLSLSYTLLFN